MRVGGLHGDLSAMDRRNVLQVRVLLPHSAGALLK